MVIKLNYKRMAIVLAASLFVSASAFALSSQQSRLSISHGVSHVGKSVCIPILMYHEVKYKSPGKDSITPYEFENDLNYFKESGYHTVTMSRLIDYVYKGKPLPEKPVIISFDDGYMSTYVTVFPLLKKYNDKMVLSIIGKSTDDFSIKPSSQISSHVTWGQIDGMKSSGLVEIQNHTYNLHTITRARFGCSKKRDESRQHYASVLACDITRLQTEIKLYTGSAPNTFTYPYGQVSADSVPVLKSLGFKASLTCNYGMNVIGSSPSQLFGLRRICRSHGVTAKSLIDGATETLRFRKDLNS